VKLQYFKFLLSENLRFRKLNSLPQPLIPAIIAGFLNKYEVDYDSIRGDETVVLMSYFDALSIENDELKVRIIDRYSSMASGSSSDFNFKLGTHSPKKYYEKVVRQITDEMTFVENSEGAVLLSVPITLTKGRPNRMNGYSHAALGYDRMMNGEGVDNPVSRFLNPKSPLPFPRPTPVFGFETVYVDHTAGSSSFGANALDSSAMHNLNHSYE